MQCPVTWDEIERRMDELAREFIETHDPEIPRDTYRLARQLEKMKNESED
jgi:hypothetical protein